ncbi:MAG TPA: type II toxin-antitoxin system HicA family toxin [Verrucomicrobiae bacterium]
MQLRQAGSHLIMRSGHRTAVVPQHKPLKPGTLKGIVGTGRLDIGGFH